MRGGRRRGKPISDKFQILVNVCTPPGPSRKGIHPVSPEQKTGGLARVENGLMVVKIHDRRGKGLGVSGVL